MVSDISKRSSISFDELSKHSSEDDVWIVVDQKVYDITEFAPTHPGGKEIILRYAGRDASVAYSEVHAPSLIGKTLDVSKHIGTINASTIPAPEESTTLNVSQSVSKAAERPPLHTLINLFDFEEVAERFSTPKTWAFYSGAANDCLTRDANRAFYEKIFLRPKLLTNASRVSTKARILGYSFDMPIFTSPCAMAKLAHPEGEMEMARGAVQAGITMCIATTASYPYAEIVAAAPPKYPFFFQLYVNKDRRKTEAMVAEVAAAGAKAIVVTIDLPVVGKREADERAASAEIINLPMSGSASGTDKKGAGLARSTGGFIDASFSWDDLPWLVGLTDLPVIPKGIQTAADAKRAMAAGCKGIFVSNHGGRALDSSAPTLLTLLELHMQCPEIFDKMEVLVDGGIRRGTDVLKALCLGATAVGIGRPFMYAVGYGKEGVEHAAFIVKDELETAMQQCGLTSLSDASPEFLNTAEIDHLVRKKPEHPYARRIARPKL